MKLVVPATWNLCGLSLPLFCCYYLNFTYEMFERFFFLLVCICKKAQALYPGCVVWLKICTKYVGDTLRIGIHSF